jgi:hypothetical protein
MNQFLFGLLLNRISSLHLSFTLFFFHFVSNGCIKYEPNYFVTQTCCSALSSCYWNDPRFAYICMAGNHTHSSPVWYLQTSFMDHTIWEGRWISIGHSIFSVLDASNCSRAQGRQNWRSVRRLKRKIPWISLVALVPKETKRRLDEGTNMWNPMDILC